MNTITRREGLRFLTQCADMQGKHWSGGIEYPLDDCPTCHGTNEAGHLYVPCSPYGRNSRDVAPVAWRLAYILARESDESITYDQLDYAMGQVVNDSDSVREIIREYGHGMYH